MIDSLSMPDIIEFLPTGLQDLIFSEDLETAKENLAKMFGLSYEDEILLHNALTKYLIGQFDINIFKTRLWKFYREGNYSSGVLLQASVSWHPLSAHLRSGKRIVIDTVIFNSSLIKHIDTGPDHAGAAAKIALNL